MSLKHKQYLTKSRQKGRRSAEDHANSVDQTVRDARRIAAFGLHEDEWKRTLVGKNPDLTFLLDGIVTRMKTVETIAREAGIRFPTAVTRAVWAEYVTVPTGCEGLQDEQGRLRDIVWMLRSAIDISHRTHPSGADIMLCKLHVVRTKQDLYRTPPLVTLKAICGPGDSGDPHGLALRGRRRRD